MDGQRPFGGGARQAWSALTLLCASGLLGLAALTGCGEDDSLPNDAVARVGDAVITTADFQRAMARSMGPGNPPWKHATCVAEKQRAADGTALGSETALRAQLERQCNAEYERLKARVVETLIKDEWTRQEARALDVVVTDADVRTALDEANTSSFLSEEALRRAGLTIKDLLPNIRLAQLKRKLADELTAEARQVAPEDVADYYREHKAELVVEERRDVRLILTKARDRAEAARAALEGGQGWATVASRYSLHKASRDRGGRVAGLRKGPLHTRLVTAIFRAPSGELSGPVEADESSWAVFLVERIQPAARATLAQARDEIRDLLASQGRRDALAAFTERYRDKTVCASGFRVVACKNGPDQASPSP